jgi:hypothetical protein
MRERTLRLAGIGRRRDPREQHSAERERQGKSRAAVSSARRSAAVGHGVVSLSTIGRLASQESQ